LDQTLLTCGFAIIKIDEQENTNVYRHVSTLYSSVARLLDAHLKPAIAEIALNLNKFFILSNFLNYEL